MNATVIPIVFGSLGTVLESLEKWLLKLEIEITALLRLTRIRRGDLEN